MTLSQDIITFAGTGNKFYEQFADYHFHKSDAEWGRKLGSYDTSVSLAEKHDKVNEAYFAEMERISGCPRNADTMDAWMANPMVNWANFAIINSTANAVLPAYVTASLSPFVDFQTVGAGDILHIKVQPRTLYTVTLGTTGERTTYRQKKYAGDVTVAPIEHIVTVYVDMKRVMAGKDDLADAVRKVILSLEIAMNKDAFAALTTGLSNIPNAFKVSGAFDTTNMIQLCQRVEAYNNGAKPIIMGTAAALANVLPSSTAGYRMNVDGVSGSVKYLADFYGYDLFELPQMPKGDAAYGLVLDDTMLYVVSPSVGSKLVTGALSTQLTNSNQFYENADLTQNFTMRKSWAFEFIGAAFCGTYDIT